MSSKPSSFQVQMECSHAVQSSQVTVRNDGAQPGTASNLQRVFGD